MNVTALTEARFARFGAAVAQVKASRTAFVRDAQDTVEKTIILGQMLRKSWETFFRGTEAGVVERARALRGFFLKQLAESLELMKFATDQAARASSLVGEPLPGADLVADGLAALESIWRQALSEWGVSEDQAAALAAMPDVPVRLDKYGDIRIGKSRVLLDTILEHHKAGMSPEEIASGYDTLQPADVYEAIAYYLRHRDDVEAYFQRRDEEATAIWQQVEASQPSRADLKARIKERWAKEKADHATPSE